MRAVAHARIGMKGVMGSGVQQGSGGTHNTPPMLPQVSGQPEWPESSGEGLRPPVY